MTAFVVNTADHITLTFDCLSFNNNNNADHKTAQQSWHLYEQEKEIKYV